jgi:hypothetical protein
MVGELDALRERLDRLERSHRRWKLGLLTVMVAITVQETAEREPQQSAGTRVTSGD